MSDIGSSESLQILSPEIQPSPLRETLKSATDIVKKEIQDNDQVMVSLDCARMNQDFGLFKEAGVSIGAYALLDQKGVIFGTSEGYLEPKEPKYYSPDEIAAIGKGLREKHGLGVTLSTPKDDFQMLYVTGWGSKIMVDFGFPNREAALRAYSGNADPHYIDPQTRLNVIVFAEGESSAEKIEDRGSVPVEENAVNLVNSVPKTIDMMTKVMEVMNGLTQKEQPKMINWIDMEVLEPTVDSGRGVIYNKNHEIAGTIITGKTSKAQQAG